VDVGERTKNSAFWLVLFCVAWNRGKCEAGEPLVGGSSII